MSMLIIGKNEHATILHKNVDVYPWKMNITINLST